MSCEVQNIKIQPHDASWEIEEQWDVECVADVSSSLNNKYFFIYSGANVKHHVWFNVGGAGVDPAPSGSTAIVVAVAVNATASTVASAVQVAVDALAAFEATVDGAVVTITAAVAGESTDWADFNSGFTLTQCQNGGKMSLGYLDGDIEVSFEETLFEVTAHQTGTNLLADLRQGTVNEITLTLKEAAYDKYKELLKSTAGGALTPMAGTEVFGWGSSKQGANTIVDARRLVLHPVALTAGDYSKDLCFWKSYPMLESMVLSGENPQTLSITFKTYKDSAKDSKIDKFVFGDWTQLVP